MFGIIDQLRKIRDLAREGKWMEALTVTFTVGQQVMDIIQQFMTPRAGTAAAESLEIVPEGEEREFDAISQEMMALASNESAARAGGGIRPMAGIDPRTGIDPATIVMIIQGFFAILDMIRRRRQQPTPTPPAPAVGTGTDEMPEVPDKPAPKGRSKPKGEGPVAPEDAE